MVKVTPIARSFNAGVWSELMRGRSDLDPYVSSLRRGKNIILTPQGPVICRSGTKFIGTALSDIETSTLFNFTFSDETATVLEFGDDRIRFFDENGIQAYAPQSATIVTTAPFVISCASMAAVPGQQVVLSNFPASYNLNGKIAYIASAAGTQYTLGGVTWPVGKPTVSFNVALVYHVPITYTEAQRQALRVVQDVDIMYLLVEDVQVAKLVYNGPFNWTLATVNFNDGPYLDTNQTTTTLTPSATGNAIPVMTTNTAPSGTATGSTNRAAVAAGGSFLGRTIQLALAASDYYMAFDAADTSYWAPSTAQQGIIEYDFPAGTVVDGYTVLPALDNQDTVYLPNDFAPKTWTFDGWNGSAWITLDRVTNYNSYSGDRSQFFELDTPASYTKYRLNVLACVTLGPIEPRVRRLVMRSTASASFTLTASSIVGINGDTGFQATDVGRLIRLQGADGFWRSVKITAVTDTTHVTVTLLGDPLGGLDAIKQWRLGAYSDTTGYPTCGELYGDRLWLGGSASAPNLIVGSNVGSYEDMTPTEADGTVLDTNSVVGFLKARKLSRIKWISADDRGLVVGTGSTEFLLSSSNSQNKQITPSNAQAVAGTRRGSASAEPVRVDDKLLFLQRNQRSLRSLEYSYAANGYTGGYISANKSQFASQLGIAKFAELDYSMEPHSIVWTRDLVGTINGFTYTPSEGVEGWHEHDFSDAVIESMVVAPQLDQRQDALWMQTQRTINGVQKRYIEFMVQPWDFDDTLDDAHFVDCGLRYSGAATASIGNLWHLEGCQVYGLADYKPFGPLTVTNGVVTLPSAASKVVVGLGYDSEAEINSLEAGAQNGTAQGKPKRINAVKVRVWASATGKVGTYRDDLGEVVYDDIEFPSANLDEVEDIGLYTGDTEAIILTEGYASKGTVSFKRPKEKPLPFNIVALLPVLETQDGG